MRNTSSHTGGDFFVFGTRPRGLPRFVELVGAEDRVFMMVGIIAGNACVV
jgi:hypothetical protein